MSTTFEVYPMNPGIPSYEAVLELATVRIGEFLRDQGIEVRLDLAVDVKGPDNRSLEVCKSAPFNIGGEAYSWFYWANRGGGTDAYFHVVEEVDWECWENEIQTKAWLGVPAEDIRTALGVGHYWAFRRSAGQPGHIALTYGFLAAAVAELTGGFLYSSDGAWDYDSMPCRTGDLITRWFRPELESRVNDAEWYRKCLDAIRAGDA